MRKYSCQCGNMLFFDNSHCTACGAEVGWCDACHNLVARSQAGECSQCGQPVANCNNREQYAICNGFVNPGESETGLCCSCVRTTVIPDVADELNLTRWRIMESGKRRLLLDLQLLGLGADVLDSPPPLSFCFKTDTPQEHVITGHADGVITINLVEADPVFREKARQEHNEPQRTSSATCGTSVGTFCG